MANEVLLGGRWIFGPSVFAIDGPVRLGLSVVYVCQVRLMIWKGS